jgi:hypothetical protein
MEIQIYAAVMCACMTVLANKFGKKKPLLTSLNEILTEHIVGTGGIRNA